jgi:HEAT repeat protein
MKENLSVDELIKKLWSREALNALNSLRELGQDALPALLIALEKDDFNYESHEYENGFLRDAIKNIGEPAFQALIHALRPESNMRRAAAKTLKRWGDKRAVEPLIIAMFDQEYHGKSYVIDAIAHFRDARAYDPLRDFLKSDVSQNKERSDFLKRCAGCALAEYGEPDLLPEIFDALKDVNPEYYTKEGIDHMIATLRKRCIENGREMDFYKNWEKVKLSHPEMVKSYEESVERLQRFQKNITG